MFYYDYSAADGHAGSDDAAADCPACRGTGKVLLLVSTKPCDACGGSGKIGPSKASSGDLTDPAGSTRPPHAGEGQGGETDDKALMETVERVPGHWVTTCRYDHLGRPLTQTEGFVAGPPERGEAEG